MTPGGRPHHSFTHHPTSYKQRTASDLVVAYGAHNWVALATADGDVRHSLRGHEGKVQCVEWLVPGRVLVSGAADGAVRVWARGDTAASWMCTEVLRPSVGERASVSRLAVLWGQWVAAATAHAVTVWQEGQGEWKEIFATAMPPTQIPCAVALVPLSNVEVALLVGAVDAKIRVWIGGAAAAPPQQPEEEVANGVGWTQAGVLTGHQGWVRSLAWRPVSAALGEGVLVASGSQDGKIRVWKIERVEGSETPATVPGRAIAAADDDDEALTDADEEMDDHEIRLLIEGRSRKYGVRLDALLVGHEDWVTGLCWAPKKDQAQQQPLALLSCSMDRSLIIWRPEGAKGVWTPRVRLGDLGVDLGGAVGSNLLGFLGCVFSADGARVLGHGFGGSFHAYQEEDREEEEEDDEGRWVPRPFATGHFEEVTDIQWEKGGGRYLVSVSKDQTTRLWAQATATQRFHEMSRVQVHGYDLTCLDLLASGGETREAQEHRLVTGADEKTLRVFDAPNKVLGLLETLCGVHSMRPGHVETAYIPALALSSKAVKVNGEQQQLEAGDGPGNGMNDDAQAIAKARARVAWEERRADDPSLLEGELVDHTLWPEVAKLYGHGNGITCLAADPTGSVVASACKARDAETAQVRLWDTATWRSAGVLPGHASTVVQLAFSHDGRVLVSVSKDRQVRLYAQAGAEKTTFAPAQTLDKAHKRIIWSCDWAHDDALLATASRDGAVKLWRRGDGAGDGGQVVLPEPLVTFKPSTNESEAVTAVAFAPIAVKEKEYLLALGLESGVIELWAGNQDAADSWRCVLVFSETLCHSATVRRLRWRPLCDEAAPLELASCGADHAVKLARILQQV